MILLAWGATIGINHIYGLAGRREATERLNPVLVQSYTSIPPHAQPYLSFKSRHLFGEVVLVVQGSTLRLDAAQWPNARKLEYEFVTTPAPEGAYELFVKPMLGRGFVTVLQSPLADNGYTAKIKIDDPYFGEGQYHFELWYQKVR